MIFDVHFPASAVLMAFPFHNAIVSLNQSEKSWDTSMRFDVLTIVTLNSDHHQSSILLIAFGQLEWK
jgi:hypothetical protein